MDDENKLKVGDSVVLFSNDGVVSNNYPGKIKSTWVDNSSGETMFQVEFSGKGEDDGNPNTGYNSWTETVTASKLRPIGATGTYENPNVLAKQAQDTPDNLVYGAGPAAAESLKPGTTLAPDGTIARLQQELNEIPHPGETSAVTGRYLDPFEAKKQSDSRIQAYIDAGRMQPGPDGNLLINVASEGAPAEWVPFGNPDVIPISNEMINNGISNGADMLGVAAVDMPTTDKNQFRPPLNLVYVGGSGQVGAVTPKGEMGLSGGYDYYDPDNKAYWHWEKGVWSYTGTLSGAVGLSAPEDKNGDGVPDALPAGVTLASSGPYSAADIQRARDRAKQFADDATDAYHIGGYGPGTTGDKFHLNPEEATLLAMTQYGVKFDADQIDAYNSYSLDIQRQLNDAAGNSAKGIAGVMQVYMNADEATKKAILDNANNPDELKKLLGQPSGLPTTNTVFNPSNLTPTQQRDWQEAKDSAQQLVKDAGLTRESNEYTQNLSSAYGAATEAQRNAYDAAPLEQKQYLNDIAGSGHAEDFKNFVTKLAESNSNAAVTPATVTPNSNPAVVTPNVTPASSSTNSGAVVTPPVIPSSGANVTTFTPTATPSNPNPAPFTYNGGTALTPEQAIQAATYGTQTVQSPNNYINGQYSGGAASMSDWTTARQDAAKLASDYTKAYSNSAVDTNYQNAAALRAERLEAGGQAQADQMAHDAAYAAAAPEQQQYLNNIVASGNQSAFEAYVTAAAKNAQ